MNKFKSVVLLSFLYVGSQGAFSSGLPPLLPPVDPLQSAIDQRLEMINRCKDYFGSSSGRSDVLAAWSQELEKLREHAIEKWKQLGIMDECKTFFLKIFYGEKDMQAAWLQELEKLQGMNSAEIKNELEKLTTIDNVKYWFEKSTGNDMPLDRLQNLLKMSLEQVDQEWDKQWMVFRCKDCYKTLYGFYGEEGMQAAWSQELEKLQGMNGADVKNELQRLNTISCTNYWFEKSTGETMPRGELEELLALKTAEEVNQKWCKQMYVRYCKAYYKTFYGEEDKDMQAVWPQELKKLQGMNLEGVKDEFYKMKAIKEMCGWFKKNTGKAMLHSELQELLALKTAEEVNQKVRELYGDRK